MLEHPPRARLEVILTYMVVGGAQPLCTRTWACGSMDTCTVQCKALRNCAYCSAVQANIHVARMVTMNEDGQYLVDNVYNDNS